MQFEDSYLKPLSTDINLEVLDKGQLALGKDMRFLKERDLKMKQE